MAPANLCLCLCPGRDGRGGAMLGGARARAFGAGVRAGVDAGTGWFGVAAAGLP